MISEDRDRQLGRLFEAERAADEAAAPDLRALLGRPAAPRARSRSLRRIFALAATVAIVVSVGTRLLRTGATASAPRNPPSDATTLAEWRSPTAFLLSTPGSEIWTQVPSLGSTALATDTHFDPSPTKGVER